MRKKGKTKEGWWQLGVLQELYSRMTAAQAGQELQKNAKAYTLTVCARNSEPQTIKGTDITYQYLISDEIQDALKQQKTDQDLLRL